MPLSELHEYENNAKIHDEPNVDAIAASIDRFGMCDPLGVWRDPQGRLVIVEGHGRKMALAELGRETAPCIILNHLTDEERKAYALAHNQTTLMTGFDMDALSLEMGDLADFEMEDFGFDVTDFDFGEEDPREAVEDEPPETAPRRCQPGDVWLLGSHRLMCGDSTDAESVRRLMDGVTADICVTSPPYGVGRSSGLRHHKESGRDNSGDITSFYAEDEDLDGWRDLMDGFFSVAQGVSVAQFVNVQMLGDNKRDLIRFVADNADALCDVMVWDKGRMIPHIQPNVLSSQFEFVFAFDAGNPSKALRFGDFRGSVSNLFTLDVGQNEYAAQHKAVFPVALPAHILDVNSKAATVYEPFGGTGTTIVACEQLGRTCYAMEISPEYCDIVLQRWEDLTGGTAVLSE